MAHSDDLGKLSSNNQKIWEMSANKSQTLIKQAQRLQLLQQERSARWIFTTFPGTATNVEAAAVPPGRDARGDASIKGPRFKQRSQNFCGC